MTLAASAYGAGDAARAAGGIAPSTPIVEKMYTAATITVPTIVARGIVRAGSRTSSAGTVADSMPRNENNVSDVAARMAEKAFGWSGGTVGAKLLQLAWKRPSVPSAINGTN